MCTSWGLLENKLWKWTISEDLSRPSKISGYTVSPVYQADYHQSRHTTILYALKVLNTIAYMVAYTLQDQVKSPWIHYCAMYYKEWKWSQQAPIWTNSHPLWYPPKALRGTRQIISVQASRMSWKCQWRFNWVTCTDRIKSEGQVVFWWVTRFWMESRVARSHSTQVLQGIRHHHYHVHSWTGSALQWRAYTIGCQWKDQSYIVSTLKGTASYWISIYITCD